MRRIEIYDTTLRDGSQAEEISLSLEDKLRITEKLDELGVHYIEGGWPGANPKDLEYFKRVDRLRLRNAKIVAFGATHKPKKRPENDETLRGLIDANTSIITIYGKTWDFHVREALKIELEENIEIIHDSVTYLKRHAEKVFFDAEHFFDGYIRNPEYAVKCLAAALHAGADCLVLCDTNGGMMTSSIKKVVRTVTKKFSAPIGIHVHNDGDCAVANSVVAVEEGASQVQGTINGFGERCGNANLVSIIPNLQLKFGMQCISPEQLKKLRDISRFVYEIANLRHFKHQPYTGDSAFAHKAGMHVSAIRKRPETYEHIVPELVGNTQRVLLSDQAGKSNILRKAEEFGIKLSSDSPQLQEIVTKLKDLENQGYQFEGAEASFELIMKKALGLHRRFFDLIEFRVIVEKRTKKEEPISEATIKLKIANDIEHTVAESKKGPVNAIDKALRKALDKSYSRQLKDVRLLDYKVRVLTAGKGTSAKVRVLVESGDRENRWGTVGVSENIIEASYQALVDSIEYKLLKEGL
ncbi:MAG TPA: citramalate synthase [Thermodesulfovibrionales bacterium]|nr:citramalate synthase [Thermodesulfovibrionales bacterium]